MKKFAELKTEKAKENRLEKYSKERESRGTEEKLCRLVAKPIVKDTTDGQKSVALRLWVGYNKETKKDEYRWANAYIRNDQPKLLEFYSTLQKGQLLSVEYFMKDNFMNIYSAFKRTPRKKAEAAN